MKRTSKLKLIPYPEQKLPVEVLLTPLGNRIKFRISGDVVCSRGNQPRLLQKSGTYSRDDHLWNAVFGSRRNMLKFLKRGRAIRKKIPISHLGFKPCDSIWTPGNCKYVKRSGA